MVEVYIPRQHVTEHHGARIDSATMSGIVLRTRGLSGVATSENEYHSFEHRVLYYGPVFFYSRSSSRSPSLAISDHAVLPSFYPSSVTSPKSMPPPKGDTMPMESHFMEV